MKYCSGRMAFLFLGWFVLHLGAAEPADTPGPGSSDDILRLLANSGFVTSNLTLPSQASGKPVSAQQGLDPITGSALGFLRQHDIPSSFIFGGKPSATLLPSWTKEVKAPVEHNDRTIYECTWREPGGGLVATWRAEVFRDWPAMEFKWIFSNEGKKPSKPLSHINALDLNAGLGASSFRVLSCTGGNPEERLDDPNLGFSLHENSGGITHLQSRGGRSSEQDLPFFLIQADSPAEGIFVGIGWSGEWRATVDGSDMTRGLHITAQMPDINLTLPPGEQIRTPSILLGVYRADKTVGSNILRSLIHAKYTPLLSGKKPLPPVSWNHWFFFQNAISESMFERQADVAAKTGIEYFCIDAGWFDGDFPDGVGNWTVNKAKFPRGLGPIGDYVARKGMKLGLWFEPERVAPNTRLAREHPEWICGNLVNLGNKEARDWLFKMLKGFIDEGHVRWIRWDFNTEPLVAWNNADAHDQHGLTQIRYIMGLYDLLDRVMKAYPDLLIEGCASGGQRIDLETIKRSHTFWKSDNTGILSDMRFHETGANTFLPAGLLNTNLLLKTLPFDTESIFGGALGFQCDWTKLEEKTLQDLTQQIALYKQLRPLLNENYYPIFPQSHEASDWVGWQFDSPSRHEGFIVVLRPLESPFNSADISLKGLDPSATYTLTRLEGAAGTPGDVRILTGEELARTWTIAIKRASSVIYTYSQTKF